MKCSKLTAILLLISAFLLISQAVLAGTKIFYGIVTAKVLKVFEEPTTKSAMVGQIPKGAEVMVWERKGSWYRIDYGDIDGWVLGKFLKVYSRTF